MTTASYCQKYLHAWQQRQQCRYPVCLHPHKNEQKIRIISRNSRVQSNMNPADYLIIISALHIVAQSAADGVPFKEAGRRRDKLLEKFVSSSLVSQNVSRVELQTKIREDFTITEKAPSKNGFLLVDGAF